MWLQDEIAGVGIHTILNNMKMNSYPGYFWNKKIRFTFLFYTLLWGPQTIDRKHPAKKGV